MRLTDRANKKMSSGSSVRQPQAGLPRAATCGPGAVCKLSQVIRRHQLVPSKSPPWRRPCGVCLHFSWRSFLEKSSALLCIAMQALGRSRLCTEMQPSTVTLGSGDLIASGRHHSALRRVNAPPSLPFHGRMAFFPSSSSMHFCVHVFPFHKDISLAMMCCLNDPISKQGRLLGAWDQHFNISFGRHPLQPMTEVTQS